MCLMDELRELNVEGIKDRRIVEICASKASLVKLRVAVDRYSTTEIAMQRPILNMSRASHLKAVILDNCVELEQVVPDVLPPSLQSFSFIITIVAIAKISSMSFWGLAKLKSVLLIGWMSLQELDLSGTAVKTLDLREVVAHNLKRLILLGCENLKAIQWPSSDKRTKKLEVLCIDTIQFASSDQANWGEKAKENSAATGSSCIVTIAAKKQSAAFNRYISLRDARLLRSLVPVRGYFGFSGGHMEMDSSPASGVVVGECAQGIRHRQPHHYLYARDIIFQDHMREVAVSEGAIKWMWDFPPVPTVDDMGWYVHIQDKVEMKTGLLQQQGSTQGTSTGALIIPSFICDGAKTLHVHDSLSITSIPIPTVLRRVSRPPRILTIRQSWGHLGWCQVERCPKLSSVFATPTPSDDEIFDTPTPSDDEIIDTPTLSDDESSNVVVECFRQLTTFWASQLSTTRYIWNWSTIQLPDAYSFQYLTIFLHIDYYCPRLIHVLPLSEDMTTLWNLETLEIVCCGDLMVPLDPERQDKQTIVNFPKLKRIHLHDLRRMQRICGGKMLAPNLESIKIRGCWSLRHLPAVAKQCPEVDCEKEWWDSLEWDEGDTNHHPSLYKPRHSRYYKKAQLPRGTVLS